MFRKTAPASRYGFLISIYTMFIDWLIVDGDCGPCQYSAYSMSTENNNRRRPYRLKARADQQALTRQRITKAVVELHETAGPAGTTVSEVAERAGVGRVTVYKHFPTEADLFRACSAHWAAEHPPPDFSDCAKIRDPEQRTRCVLGRLYPYFREAHPMMSRILRDAPLLPALQDILDNGWFPIMRQLGRILVPGGLNASSRRRAHAAASVILDLRTWENLTGTGLDDAAAAEVAAKMYAGILD
ncbi:MAG: helix-turn-helix domain containing protein [Nevskiales bacterium]|nr:helix-turn-helix domain containing protein [Nevskiales bacterium]